MCDWRTRLVNTRHENNIERRGGHSNHDMSMNNRRIHNCYRGDLQITID